MVHIFVGNSISFTLKNTTTLIIHFFPPAQTWNPNSHMLSKDIKTACVPFTLGSSINQCTPKWEKKKIYEKDIWGDF